jgi:TIR domain
MRVFISHGTDKSIDAELAFLDALHAELCAPGDGRPGPEVLLDRTRLEAGDDWTGVLHDWLAECHAAVLLLSPRALSRPWVLKEATVLAFRWNIDPSFTLIPVMLPGVDSKMLAEHPSLSALSLPDIQSVGPNADPAALAIMLRKKLLAIDPNALTPLDRLERVIETYIRLADEDTIETACDSLIGERVLWRPDLERRRQCARVFARAIVRGRLGGQKSLSRFASTLKNAALDRERIFHVLKLAAPSWVDEEVASRLRTQVQATPATRQICALNSGRVQHGALMAVWRSQLPQIAENVFWVAGGGADNWADELPERICAAFRKRAPEDYDDLTQVAEELEDRSDPIFFVLPPPVPDRALRDELQRRFPSAVFIAHTGTQLPANLPPHVLPLLPGLALDVETRSRADYRSALEFA